MPSVSDSQHRWVALMATNPEARKHSGLSEAKAQEWLHADKGSPWKRDAGGGLAGGMAGGASPGGGGIGGVTPGQMGMNPQLAGIVQRYSQLPTEKLQELAGAMGGSQYGQLIRQVLNQRLAMPNAQPSPGQQQQQGMALPPSPQLSSGTQGQQPSVPFAVGGGVEPRAEGGITGVPLGEADPWWTRSESRSDVGGGFLHGSSMGRADELKTNTPAGSYILPADVVAGLGEGNSLAGARFWQEAMATGPWGTPLEHAHGSARLPNAMSGRWRDSSRGYAAGGVSGQNHEMRPVDLSHGEIVVPPHVVRALGDGDQEAGIKELDAWVIMRRKQQIKEQQNLPPPVGARVKKPKRAKK